MLFEVFPPFHVGDGYLHFASLLRFVMAPTRSQASHRRKLNLAITADSLQYLQSLVGGFNLVMWFCSSLCPRVNLGRAARANDNILVKFVQWGYDNNKTLSLSALLRSLPFSTASLCRVVFLAPGLQ